jgi:hypothetical protein
MHRRFVAHLYFAQNITLNKGAKISFRTLYTRMDFSAAAAQSMLVDEQGLTSLDDIKVLTKQPEGRVPLQEGHTLPRWPQS